MSLGPPQLDRPTRRRLPTRCSSGTIVTRCSSGSGLPATLRHTSVSAPSYSSDTSGFGSPARVSARPAIAWPSAVGCNLNLEYSVSDPISIGWVNGVDLNVIAALDDDGGESLLGQEASAQVVSRLRVRFDF